MSKLKGVKKLNKAIKKTLSPFDIEKISLCGEYAYYFDVNKITYKLTRDITDELFDKFVEEKFNYKVKYPFVISLLHEVGHKLNNDIIEGSIYQYCLDEKARIESITAEMEDKEEFKKLSYEYFSLPDEMLATSWAIDYAKTHPRRIERMWKKMGREIMNFYEKNSLTND